VYILKKLKVWFILSLVMNLLLIGIGSFVVYKQGGMAVVKKLFSSEEYSEYYIQKKVSFESYDYPDVDKVFLGDSITDHGELQTYFPGEVVLNRGIVEDDTKGVLNRIDEVVKRNPQEVYILIGINDIGGNVDIEEYRKNMEKIIQSFDHSSTKVIVQSILPVNNQEFENKISNEAVHQFNEVLHQLAKDNDIQYVDLNRHFENADGQLKEEYTVDGIHLTGDGYDVWMEKLKSK
jgi:lysophospholipase L1-like esterase